jgi:hypothetical protein
VEVSNRIRWEIDRDVIKGREFDFPMGCRKLMIGVARWCPVYLPVGIKTLKKEAST